MGIVSKKSKAKKTYASKIPNDIGAKIIDLLPSLRSYNRFFVSLIKSNDAETVNT